MGYGTTIMIIILFVNLIVYLGALAMDNSDIASPVISLLIDVAEGDIISLIPTTADLISSQTVILGLIIAGIIGMSSLTGTYSLTGIGGSGVGASQLPMLIGVFIFTSFFLLPDFQAMNFPSPLGDVIYAIFGLLLAVGLNGVIRGE